VYPLGSIALPVTFGTEENFRTKSVQFNVAEVNLPFNAIISRLALYRLMAIAHYGYLVLKMSSPAGVLTVRGDRPAALAAVEKLHALEAEAARPDDVGRDPLDFLYQDACQGAKGAAIWGRRRPRQDHPAQHGFPPDHSNRG
jgi:hypothetical protein